MAFTENIEQLVELNAEGLVSKYESWGRISLGKVAKVINGFAFKSSHFNTEGAGHPLIRIRDILANQTSTFYSGQIPEGFWVTKGDLLVGMDGDFNTCQWRSGDALLNQRVCKISTYKRALYNEQFLYYALPGYLQLIHQHTSATTVKHLSSKTLSEIPLPLPPLNEQTRIANKLDSLLAKVDAAQARLDKVPALLKRFRQSVLAAATSGALTDSKQFKSLEISELAKVIGGLTKNKNRNSFPLKMKYLRVANVYENQFKLDDVAEIGVAEKELNRVLLQDQDLLVVEGNGSLDHIGRVALWENQIEPCVHQNHLIKIRCNVEKIAPKFLLFYLMSPQGKQAIVEKATSGAGLYTLSISKISSISAPLYPLETQERIIERIESLFAIADKAEQQYSTAKARLDKLTQSLLAKAFRGELVPQDPNDEPASELLKRIEAEREQQKAQPKRTANTRKRKTTTKKKPMKLAETPENYLLDLLAKLGGEAQAEALWKQSDLSIDDFYAQLKLEMADNKIIDHNPSADPSLRKLKVA